MRAKASHTHPGQLSLPVHLDDGATLANFFVPENGTNAAALQAVKDDIFQSVYFWGGIGAGVSHLLQAACQRASVEGRSAIYLPLKQFLQQSAEDVLVGLESMNLVCLDDLDSVVCDSKWAEQVFHLFNRSESTGCQLLFGAKVSPTNIETPLADLRSRLSSLLVHKIKKLSDDESVQALRFRARLRGMEMPSAVAEYLLATYSRKSSHQFAALDKLDKATLAKKRKLTVPFVKTVLEVLETTNHE